MQSGGFLESFRSCGWASWLALLVCFAGMAAALVGVLLALFGSKKAGWILGAVAVFFGLTTVLVGFVGRAHGMTVMEEALSSGSVSPDQRDMIRRFGTEEANQCVKVGGTFAALPLLIGATTIALALALRKKPA
ncbi:MAG: hypothetical protein R3B70_26510 [Polyangiaceae bacterium]